MISHEHRCIFIHVPRTGGTSIENIIWPGPPDRRTEADLWMGFVDRYHNRYQTGGLQHLLGTQVRQEVGDDVFDRYFKFAIVRNPWDKAVSQFGYMAKRRDLRKFIRMKRRDDFKRYLEKIRATRHVQWEPQVNFLRDDHGDLLVDHVGRFETFDESVREVLRRIELDGRDIPHVNRSSRGPYRDYHDDETREMIAEMYADDIDAFRYRFDDGSEDGKG